MNVNITNEYEGSLPENTEQILSEICEKVIDFEDCPYDFTVDILLTDDASIREINREQRGIDQSTDVLSFPLIDFDQPSCFDGFDDRYELFDPEEGLLMLGDIVISVEHVFHQAEEYGHSVQRELAFLCAHSMLHLLGYDHEEEEGRKVMEDRQRTLLDEAGYRR